MKNQQRLREIAAAVLADPNSLLAVELRRIGGVADSTGAVMPPGEARPPLEVGSIKIKPAPPDLAQTGLLAWVSCIVGGLYQFDGLAVRITSGGRIATRFPSRRDAAGREHPYIRPLRRAMREEIERQLLHAYEAWELKRTPRSEARM